MPAASAEYEYVSSGDSGNKRKRKLKISSFNIVDCFCTYTPPADFIYLKTTHTYEYVSILTIDRYEIVN